MHHANPSRTREIEAWDRQPHRRRTQIAHLHPILGRGRHQFGVIRQQRVQARLDVEPERHRQQQRFAPRRRQLAAPGSNANQDGRGTQRLSGIDIGDDRNVAPREWHNTGGRLTHLRAVDNADNVAITKAQHAVTRLGVGLIKQSLRQNCETLTHTALTPSPGADATVTTPSSNPNPSNGPSSISKCPSRSM